MIELLVVVAIIALLIALLLPMLDSARDRAVTIQCLSNMKQQAMGHLVYCADFDGTFKSATDGIGGLGYPNPWIGDWYTVMNSYVGTDSIWTCPGAPPSTGTHHSSMNPLLDYLASANNGVGLGWGVTLAYKKQYIRLTMLPYPSTTGLYFERIQYSAPDLDQCWFNGYGPPWILPNWNTDYGCWPFHNKMAMQSAVMWTPGGTGMRWWPRDTNVARVDGSARSYPWVDLKQGALPPLSSVPPGYSGAQFARAYLVTGYAPRNTVGGVLKDGGWLSDN